MPDNSEIENAEYQQLRKEYDGWKHGLFKSAISPRDRHWAACRERMENFDNAACKAWTDSVDTLLIFAMILSVIVTPFTLVSLSWLTVDYDAVTAAALIKISTQLSGAGQEIYTPEPFAPSSLSTRINAYWLVSLTLALIAALLGILCKQWLSEFQVYPPISDRQFVAVRQMRFEALRFWKVDVFIASLPLLLVAAFILFFVGLLELLWSRNKAIAILITLAFSMAMISSRRLFFPPSFTSSTQAPLSPRR